MTFITDRVDDVLFRRVTIALGACLDYLEEMHTEDVKCGLAHEKEHWLVVEQRPVYQQAIELIRPDLCPVCGFYKTIHPTEDCERRFDDPKYPQSTAV